MAVPFIVLVTDIRPDGSMRILSMWNDAVAAQAWINAQPGTHGSYRLVKLLVAV